MKKKKPKNNKLTAEKIITFGIMLLIALSLVVLVKALTNDEKTDLQDELNNLTSSFNYEGYNWLVDYDVSYPSVNVYRENSNELLAQFSPITSGENDSFSKYQIFLTSLGENERISYEVYLMKMRIDDIRKELDCKGGFK